MTELTNTGTRMAGILAALEPKKRKAAKRTRERGLQIGYDYLEDPTVTDPALVATHDQIIKELTALERAPRERMPTDPRAMQSAYARQRDLENRYGRGMLTFIKETGLGALAGALYEIHPTIADSANVTFGLIGLADLAVSGNKLRTSAALLTGYLAGRAAVKALKYNYDVHTIPVPSEMSKPKLPHFDYI